MKFLVMMSPKDIFFTQSPSAILKLNEESTAWMNKKIQEGLILENYSLAGWNKYVWICQLNSAEDIDRLMRGHPGTMFLNYETYPLSDMAETAKANIEVARAAEKRMS